MGPSCTIVGAGIVGLATAYQLTRSNPNIRITILEKESDIAKHQSGHNSGVIHSGIYYKPRSLKALTCREGKGLLEDFAAEHQISHEICGKVIVATDKEELPTLKMLYERGRENGVQCELIDKSTLSQYEPDVRGIKALHVPEAGIIDYKAICRRLSELLTEAGQVIRCNFTVSSIKRTNNQYIFLSHVGEEHSSESFISCAGLYSDKLAKQSGLSTSVQIIPFRGEYYKLQPEASKLINNLVYPVPDPQFPFLGVHFTRTTEGIIECGPNAVLALSREGYRWRDLNIYELLETLTFRGFHNLSLKHPKEGLREIIRSLSKREFLRSLKKFLPDLSMTDIEPYGAGVRAQAVDSGGKLLDDFHYVSEGNALHVLNAPSPAATASLAIGKMIASQYIEQVRSTITAAS